MKVLIIEIVVVVALIVAVVMVFVKSEAVSRHRHEIIAGLLVFAAALLPFHQRLIHDFWFHRQGFWNHEALEACAIALAAGLLIGKYMEKRSKND
jgi:hypothetical protein